MNRREEQEDSFFPFPFRLAHSYPPPVSLFHCLEKNSRTSRDKETRDKDEGKETEKKRKEGKIDERNDDGVPGCPLRFR